ncbi:MAG: lytic transglycosylase domain-containing protein [Sphingobacteriales bacterium]|nr:MAG: lytic transglycosylase domain-containing protein [Sphingobacteriales bacterium]TAF79342.1 MAG: lytic transglycosylase domain-containing protein [Sphingobacteriales bacterium]
MTKSKLIITCKLLLLFVLVKINIYTSSPKATLANLAIPPSPNIVPITPKIASRSLSFASENIPVGNKKIAYKMKRVLKANSYSKLQTHKLHYKALKWFSIIEPILKQHGIPDDFKYIPLVETGLTSNIYSSKGAAGLWQFMPQTGRDFGLKVNSTVDERFNIRLSTLAAAKYFKSLYKVFGNWTLVAAAYNGGQGRIKRQVKSQKQANYFKLKLNPETASYVYSIISMKEIIEYPEKYGYKISNLRWLAYQVR